MTKRKGIKMELTSKKTGVKWGITMIKIKDGYEFKNLTVVECNKFINPTKVKNGGIMEIINKEMPIIGGV